VSPKDLLKPEKDENAKVPSSAPRSFEIAKMKDRALHWAEGF
jgi:hypothetical protein